ncbi:unnamed protein product, partial [Pocillopora meandrina]
RYARRSSLSDLSSDDEREVPKHYIGNVVLLIVPLAILDDFSNNGIIPFVMNARNSHLELIAKTHPIRVEIMLPFLWILITFSNQRIYFRMILVPENRVRQQRKTWNDGLVTKVTKVPEHREDGHCVCRKTFINKSDNSLRKTIANVVLPDSQHHNVEFVRFYFEGASEHRIKLKAHGNATTSSIPYLRTYGSTETKMMGAVSRNKAGLKRVVYQVEEDVGGLKKCKSGGQLPRSEIQVKYLKVESQPRKAVKDPIFQITEKMKEQSQTGENSFGHAIR